jgi:hypothetical protein
MARNDTFSVEEITNNPPPFDIRAKAKKVVVITYEIDEETFGTLTQTLYSSGAMGIALADAFQSATKEAIHKLTD